MSDMESFSYGLAMLIAKSNIQNPVEVTIKFTSEQEKHQFSVALLREIAPLMTGLVDLPRIEMHGIVYNLVSGGRHAV